MDIGRCLILLQSWALYRIPFLASISYQSYIFPLVNRPVINFRVVEWYHGDRVLLQFGCIQYISTLPIRLGEIHGMSRRGRYGNDWREVHEEYITMWNNRLGGYLRWIVLWICSPR
ncbi:hypothetical protein Gotur_014931 [Gossypium turneri]